MSPDRNDPLPPLSTDFALRVLQRAKQTRRRNSTVRMALGLGASLAVAVLIVRPGHTAGPLHAPIVSGALASTEVGDVEVADSLDSDDGDPGAYFFPDAQVDSQLASDTQALSDDESQESSSLGDGTDE